MNNSSGIYQVDELLKAKLRGSGLEPYVEVVAHIDTEAEKSLIPLYRLETLSPGGYNARAVAGSSNGRTPGSGPGSLGSNPSPAASRKPPESRGFLASGRSQVARARRW